MPNASVCNAARGGLAALALVAALGGCDTGPPPPNLILITLDTTRADRFGCYGYGIETTPNLDRLAAGGARFTHAVAQSSTTPVSCASQLTGRYPYQHGLRSMHDRRLNRLDDDVPMVQELLRKRGYRTGAFVSAYPASSAYGFSRGFDRFDETFLIERPAAEIADDGRVNTGGSQRTAAETTARLLPWLGARERRPFFAWVHFFDPHDLTLMPPTELVKPFVRSSVNEDRDEFLRSIYDAEVFFMDQQIGLIEAELDELGLRDNTVLIVTADHGEGLGDHDWWGHGILYQEQIRAPLILNGPGIPQGLVSDTPVEHVDLFPTLLELAGAGSAGEPGDLPGRSLLATLSADTAETDAERTLYSEVHNVLALDESVEQRARGEMYAVIRGKLKLIHLPGAPALDQLYDLERDPTEQRNLIADRPEDAGELLRVLAERDAIDGSVPDPTTLSPEELEHLRSLGYVR